MKVSQFHFIFITVYNPKVGKTSNGDKNNVWKVSSKPCMQFEEIQGFWQLKWGLRQHDGAVGKVVYMYAVLLPQIVYFSEKDTN